MLVYNGMNTVFSVLTYTVKNLDCRVVQSIRVSTDRACQLDAAIKRYVLW
jgi:hypothetical protein